MSKLGSTLIASLVLTAPVWAQSVFPPDGSSINQLRPNIGCDWGGGAINLQLFIDGRDMTAAANKNGGRIDLNPNFDVGYGSHVVESRCLALLGTPRSKQWRFTIVGGNNPSPKPPVSGGGATRLYPLAESVVNEVRPRISADFPENLRSVKAFLDGQDVSHLSGINGNTVAFTPQSDLTQGNHQVSLEVTYQNGAQAVQNWTFRARPNHQGNPNPGSPPGFTNYSPSQNANINNARPFISADFGVVLDNLRLFVDKNDVTNQAQITSNRVGWNPSYDLSNGSHNVRLEGRQTSNNQFVSADWQFNVNVGGNNRPPSNTPEDVNFGVDTPLDGDRVNASFRVTGDAPANSTVRVSVKPLPNRNKVASFTGKSNANGNYNLMVTPAWALRGMRMEVTTTVVDRRGRPIADPVVLTVIRR